MTKRLSRENKQTITADYVRALLDYNPETGNFNWKPRGVGSKSKGGPAGYVDPRGYRYITINKSSYRANRLAWLIMTGSWPTHFMDHRDCNTSNDAFCNLREATPAQNAANRKIHNASTSKFKGVSFCPRDGKWKTQIMINGKSYYLGQFKSPEEAHAIYAAAAKKYFGEFFRAA